MFKGKGAMSDSLMGAQDLLQFIGDSGKNAFLHMQCSSFGLTKKEVWKQRFVVLFRDMIYVYENSKSKKPLECIPLLGYDKIQRFNSDKYPWSFSIVPSVTSMKTHVFSCVSDVERRQWMDLLKKHMCWANDKNTENSEAVAPNKEAGTEAYVNIERPVAESRKPATMLRTTLSRTNLELNQDTSLDYKDAESTSEENESCDQARIVVRGYGHQNSALIKDRSWTKSKYENVESSRLNQYELASNINQNFPPPIPPRVSLIVPDTVSRSHYQAPSSTAMDSGAVETQPIQSPDYELNIVLVAENASQPNNTSSEKNDLIIDKAFTTSFAQYDTLSSTSLLDSCLITDPALERDPEACAALLKKTGRVGTYLIRKSRQSECLVLSVLTENDIVKEFRLTEKDKPYCIPGTNTIISIEEILLHFTYKVHLTSVNHFLGDGYFVHEAKRGGYTQIQDVISREK